MMTLHTATTIDPVSAFPAPVKRPVMVQEWRDVAFLHWRVDPSVVDRLTPEGLEPDTFDGSAWVGLVAFHMIDIGLPHTPAVPYLGTFPETNVRTYVKDRSGRPGVWFHSLEASRLLPVWVARAGYDLPYMWARMSIARSEGTIRYASSRRWPGPNGAGGVLSIEPEREPHAPDALDDFLTSRWGLYATGRSGKLSYAPVEHPAWPLHRASAPHVRDSLIAAAGYPPPVDPPHVLYSPGVPVRVGLPRRVH